VATTNGGHEVARPGQRQVVWSCSDCGTTDADLAYSSGRMRRCKDCQRFWNVQVNARRPRKRTAAPLLMFDRTAFLAWVHGKPRICSYCGVEERRLKTLALRTQIGRSLESLGIDRVNNDGPYALDNIDLCCLPCNKAKGNVFSATEMHEVGRGIAKVWDLRDPA
jgi:hypothetical protein